MNRMNVADVNASTEVTLDAYRDSEGTKCVAVHAVKPCGCDGPWIGELRQHNPPEAVLQGEARLWWWFPVLPDNPYKLDWRPIGQDFGKMSAALALRDYIAIRNEEAA